jgi:hypothetical protein
LLKEDLWLLVEVVHPENSLPNTTRLLSPKIILVVALEILAVANHPKL